MTPHSTSDALLSYVKDRAGTYFRGLARYDSQDADLMAVRKNLNEEAMEDRVTELHDAIQSRSEFDAMETLGPPSSIIQLREKAVLVNFPVDDERGYLPGLESETARDLHAFVTDCHHISQKGGEDDEA